MWAQIGVSFALLLTLGSQGFDAVLSSINIKTYRTAIIQQSAGEWKAPIMHLSLYVFTGMRRDHASDCQNKSEHVRRFQTRGCHAHPVYCQWILLLIKSFLLIIYSPLFTGSLILEVMLVFFFTCLSEWLDYNLLHKEQANWCQSDLLHRWSVSKGPLSLTLAYWEERERCWAQFIWCKIRLSSLTSRCFRKFRTLAPCSFFWCWLRIREKTTGEADTEVICENTRGMDGKEKRVFAAHNKRNMGC